MQFYWPFTHPSEAGVFILVAFHFIKEPSSRLPSVPGGVRAAGARPGSVWPPHGVDPAVPAPAGVAAALRVSRGAARGGGAVRGVGGPRGAAVRRCRRPGAGGAASPPPRSVGRPRCRLSPGAVSPPPSRVPFLCPPGGDCLFSCGVSSVNGLFRPVEYFFCRFVFFTLVSTCPLHTLHIKPCQLYAVKGLPVLSPVFSCYLKFLLMNDNFNIVKFINFFFFCS